MKGLGLELMSLRTVVSSTLTLLLLTGAAGAQDGTSNPRWPDALKKRNARYALLDRVDDPVGDAHEGCMVLATTKRVGDPVGDHEEAFRGRMAAKTPPRAAQHANIRRLVDDAGDEREVIIARRPGASRHAETRRFRDFAGDKVELAQFRHDQRTGPAAEDRYELTDQTESHRKSDYFSEREEVLHKDGESLRNQEARHEREELRRTERDIMRDESISERQRARLEEQAERDAEKDAEKVAEKAEKDDEKAADDEAEAAEDKAERAAEQQAERRVERAAERADRDTDRQIQREEDKPTAGSSR